MDRFARGARVSGPKVARIAKSISAEQPLTLDEIIYVLMDVRRGRYGDITKEQLLNFVSKAWDTYDQASPPAKDSKHG